MLQRALSAIRLNSSGATGKACLRGCLTASATLLLSVALSPAAPAASPLWVTKLCHRVPRTEEELATAHRESKNSCIQVPVGDALEVTGFAEPTTYDISITKGGEKQKLKLQYDLSRLNVLSIGLSVPPEEMPKLPAVSKPTIMRRIDHNFIMIQARFHRDRESGLSYLYFKPFALVGRYDDQQVAHEFTPLMEDSVRDMRAIGLFLPEGTAPSAENLRTLVCVNRDRMLLPDASGTPTVQRHYELVLVRARVTDGQVTLHTFVTDEFTRRLRYMPPCVAPTSKQQCSMVHSLRFTAYTAAKQSPSEKVTLSVAFNSRGQWWVEALDKAVAEAGLTGGAFENLSWVLDALIDGKIPATGPAENLETPVAAPAP